MMTSEADFDDTGPSLPIILIGAACGVAFGVIGLYLLHSGGMGFTCQCVCCRLWAPVPGWALPAPGSPA